MITFDQLIQVCERADAAEYTLSCRSYVAHMSLVSTECTHILHLIYIPEYHITYISIEISRKYIAICTDTYSFCSACVHIRQHVPDLLLDTYVD